MVTSEDELPLVLHRDSVGKNIAHGKLKTTYGIKAASLFDVPVLWTPDFFVVSTGLYKRYQDTSEHGQPLSVDMLLTDAEQLELREALGVTEVGEDTWIIVRSSATDEGINRRGRYRSESCRPTLTAFMDAAQRIFESCPAEEITEMGIIAQKYIRVCRASGHLSNERRVSKRASSWMCEFDSVSGVGSARIQRVSSSVVASADEHAELVCRDRQSLTQVLKRVAAWAYRKKQRMHFEWVWDGARVWIVQADVIPHARGERPSALEWQGTAVREPSCLSTLVPEKMIPKGLWGKLDCVKVFRDCGLPTTDLWVLADNNTLMGLRKGQCPKALLSDLNSLMAAPIVIRTDVGTGRDLSKFMLARTHTLHTVEAAVEFLVNTSAQVAKEYGEDATFCFILHRFIPAKSSAFGLAAPNETRVKIDGIWGLPDGLSFYPHDSYDLAQDGTGEIQRKVRYKQEYLDTDFNGRWVPKKLSSPLDWRSSLDEDELRAIASGTFQVACAVASSVQVMWFVGIPEGIGHPRCLPWFFNEASPPREVVCQPADLVNKAPIIRKPDDLEMLRGELEDAKSISVIRLRPIPELLRSREFVDSVAAFARRLSISVLIEGSVLSHAYYMLRQSGVKVTCADPFSPVFERRQFNKLVRDKIPLRIYSRGEKVRVLRLAKHSLSSVLRSKVVEEAIELFWAETSDETKEEVADLLEIIEALRLHEGIDGTELKRLEETKRENRGGFAEGLILTETEEVPIIRAVHEAGDLFASAEPPEESKMDLREAESIELGPVPHVEGPRLVIPLVPPYPRERHFGHMFQFETAGVMVNIRFREKDIIVEVNPTRRKENDEHERQLRLF